MTSNVDWVSVGDPVVVDWGQTLPLFGLDALDDVEGATASPAGRILAKGEDGQWRPIPPGVPPSGYRHDQIIPASVVTINHDLNRYPAAIGLYSLDLSESYEEFLVQHLDVNTLRITMDIPTAVVALLV